MLAQLLVPAAHHKVAFQLLQHLGPEAAWAAGAGARSLVALDVIVQEVHLFLAAAAAGQVGLLRLLVELVDLANGAAAGAAAEHRTATPGLVPVEHHFSAAGPAEVAAMMP